MKKIKKLVTVVMSILLAVSLTSHSANAASESEDNAHIIRVTKLGGNRSLEVIAVSESFDISVDTGNGLDDGDLISIDFRYSSREKIVIIATFGRNGVKDRMYTKELSVYNPDGIDFSCRTTELIQQDDDVATCVLPLQEVSEERVQTERDVKSPPSSTSEPKTHSMSSPMPSTWDDEHDEDKGGSRETDHDHTGPRSMYDHDSVEDHRRRELDSPRDRTEESEYRYH